MTEEIKKLITDSKNICLIPSQINGPESLTSSLALFYTLKELHKNVNLIAPDFPEKLDFLIPSLDFITSPKNFIISIPQSVTEVSQVYYEKNELGLKIHLTLDRGHIKREDISFYFSDIKPDLVITLGIQNFTNELSGKLDSFGFILDVPIINIDSNITENTKFGKINIVENKSISETTLELIKQFGENMVSRNVSNCILAGLNIVYENFKSERTTYEIFQLCTELIKRGASNYQITNNLNKMSHKETQFFYNIFQNLKPIEGINTSFAILNTSEFNDFGEPEANFAIEKIKTMGLQNNLLVLWNSHNSGSMIKGFFYSKKPDLINKVTNDGQSKAKGDWVFLSIQDTNINLVKDNITKLLFNNN